MRDKIKEYFKELRFSKKNHLGLGDIRMTIGDQEYLLSLIQSEQEGKCKKCHYKRQYKIDRDNDLYDSDFGRITGTQRGRK